LPHHGMLSSCSAEHFVFYVDINAFIVRLFHFRCIEILSLLTPPIHFFIFEDFQHWFYSFFFSLLSFYIYRCARIARLLTERN